MSDKVAEALERIRAHHEPFNGDQCLGCAVDRSDEPPHPCPTLQLAEALALAIRLVKALDAARDAEHLETILLSVAGMDKKPVEHKRVMGSSGYLVVDHCSCGKHNCSELAGMGGEG